MEPNLDQVAKELYGKIQTRFPDIKMADEKAQVLSKKEDIPKARFFEFEYKEGGEALGTISINLDAEDGIVIQISGDLTNDEEETTEHGAYKFIKSFRNFARSHMLKYEINNMGKSSLDKRDYEFHAKRGEEPMTESKMWGTSKVSYQDLGETRIVVRHSKPVNYDLAAGRTMHIDAIYIENAGGERFRYPVRHLNGARAMAQHIAHGGNPYDAIGQHVVSLSEELSKLRMFKGYVSRTPVVSESMSAVNDKVIERIDQVKKEIHQLQQSKHYETFAESFSPYEAKEIPEEIMLDWVDRLTVRSFKEELKDVFPYIYKLVDESEIPTKELDPDDLLDEAGSPAQQAAIAIAKKKAKKVSESPEDQFENFLDTIVAETQGADVLHGNQDAVQELKDEIAKGELKGDLNQSSVVGNFINDDELLDILDKTSGNVDAWPVVKAWLDQKDPDLANELFADYNASGAGEEAAPVPPPPEGKEAAPVPPPPEGEEAAPVPPPPEGEEAAPVPPPPAPMAESDDVAPWYKDKAEQDADKHKQTFKKPAQAGKGMDRARALAQLALKKGAKSDTKIGNKTLHDVMLELGMDPEDPAAKEIAPPAEPAGDSFEDMMAFASGFYNKEEHNFTRGVTDLETKLMKQFPGANPRDMQRVVMAARKIDPPSSVHKQEHDRMLKLAGVGHDAEVDEALPLDQLRQAAGYDASKDVVSQQLAKLGPLGKKPVTPLQPGQKIGVLKPTMESSTRESINESLYIIRKLSGLK